MVYEQSLIARAKVSLAADVVLSNISYIPIGQLRRITDIDRHMLYGKAILDELGTNGVRVARDAEFIDDSGALYTVTGVRYTSDGNETVSESYKHLIDREAKHLANQLRHAEDTWLMRIGLTSKEVQ